MCLCLPRVWKGVGSLIPDCQWGRDICDPGPPTAHPFFDPTALGMTARGPCRNGGVPLEWGSWGSDKQAENTAQGEESVSPTTHLRKVFQTQTDQAAETEVSLRDHRQVLGWQGAPEEIFSAQMAESGRTWQENLRGSKRRMVLSQKCPQFLWTLGIPGAVDQQGLAQLSLAQS